MNDHNSKKQPEHQRGNLDQKKILLSFPIISTIVIAFIAVAGVLTLVIYLFQMYTGAQDKVQDALEKEKNALEKEKIALVAQKVQEIESGKANHAREAAALSNSVEDKKISIRLLNIKIQEYEKELNAKERLLSAVSSKQTKSSAAEKEKEILNGEIQRLKTELKLLKIDKIKKNIPIKFVFKTKSAKKADTDDHVTVVFSDSDDELSLTRHSSEKVIAEFNFPGNEFPIGEEVSFTRSVSDTSFLEATYVKIINYGVDCWKPDTFSLTLGERQLFSISLVANKLGSNANTDCIQNYRSKTWSTRSYWQERLGNLIIPSNTVGDSELSNSQ